MAKKRLVCDECGVPRNRLVPVVQHRDGRIERVCVPCYKRLDYRYFMWPSTNLLAGIVDPGPE